MGLGLRFYNNNNEYLERLTRTGPKRLHVLYKHIFVKIQCIQHGCTHTRGTHTQTRTRMHTHTDTTEYTQVAYQGSLQFLWSQCSLNGSQLNWVLTQGQSLQPWCRSQPTVLRLYCVLTPVPGLATVCSHWSEAWLLCAHNSFSHDLGAHKLPGFNLSLIHIWRCRRCHLCRSRWSPYH